jgi:hypothetical protein
MCGAVNLGYLDRNGRAYGLDFTSTGRRLLDLKGELLPPEEVVVHRGEAVCSLSKKATLGREDLMVPTLAEVIRTEARLLVLVIPTRERQPDEPSRFVKGAEGVPVAAIRHLLLEGGGREYLEALSDEVLGGRVRKGAAEVVVGSGPTRDKPRSGDRVIRMAPKGDPREFLSHILP